MDVSAKKDNLGNVFNIEVKSGHWIEHLVDVKDLSFHKVLVYSDK